MVTEPDGRLRFSKDFTSTGFASTAQTLSLSVMPFQAGVVMFSVTIPANHPTNGFSHVISYDVTDGK